MRTVNQSASFARASQVAVNSVVVGLRALRHLTLERISAKAGRGTKWTTTSLAMTGKPAIRTSWAIPCSSIMSDRKIDGLRLTHAFLAMHAAEYGQYPAAPVFAG